MSRASGTFEAKMVPQQDNEAGNPAVSRMSIDKQFSGDLEGVSKGQMLATMSEASGSGGYVAIERVTGKLEGREGGFALQHTGTMRRGAPELSVKVVPDSGTGQLVGIDGKMTINVVEGKHLYDFEYTFAEPA